MVFFPQIQLMEKTLRRTLTTTTLDHLARNNMLREVGRFNGVKYVSNTSDSFSVLGKAKLQNRGGESTDYLVFRVTVIIRAS